MTPNKKRDELVTKYGKQFQHLDSDEQEVIS